MLQFGKGGGGGKRRGGGVEWGGEWGGETGGARAVITRGNLPAEV